MLDVQRQTRKEVITAVGDDGQLYPISKWDAHVSNVQHLAVSVFVFNRGRLLLQQRADSKYHSGGLWANTCCSHPHWNESLAACAQRRLFEEVGCSGIELTCFGKITYQTAVGDELFENEIAHCFVGYVDDGSPLTLYNPEEVQAVRWHDMRTLSEDIRNNPENYSEWLYIYINQYFDLISDVAHGLPEEITGRVPAQA